MTSAQARGHQYHLNFVHHARSKHAYVQQQQTQQDMKNQSKHVQKQQGRQHGVHMQMTTTREQTNSKVENQAQTAEKNH